MEAVSERAVCDLYIDLYHVNPGNTNGGNNGRNGIFCFSNHRNKDNIYEKRLQLSGTW